MIKPLSTLLLLFLGTGCANQEPASVEHHGFANNTKGHYLLLNNGKEPLNVETKSIPIPEPKTLKTKTNTTNDNVIVINDKMPLETKNLKQIEDKNFKKPINTTNANSRIHNNENYITKHRNCINGFISDPFRSNVDEKVIEGINITIESDSDVYATQDGKIVFAGYDEELGNLVIIEVQNKQDFFLAFAHMDSVKTTANKSIKSGDVIGSIKKGNKLHVAVRQDKKPVDPSAYINTCKN